MRNFLRINIEEQPNQYYLINGEVTIADDYTKSLKDINKDVFNFLGYGTHIGSETEDGKPDKRLLRFYKENPDKIPDFHKQIFDALTAPKPRSAE